MTLTLAITPENATISDKEELQYTLTGTWTGGGSPIVVDLTRDDSTVWTSDAKDKVDIKSGGGPKDRHKRGLAKGKKQTGDTAIRASYPDPDAPGGRQEVSTPVTVIP